MRSLPSSVNVRRVGQVCVDAALLALAYWLAYLLRFDEGIPHRYQELLLDTIWITVPMQVAIFAAFGLYSKLWRFVDQKDFETILKATLASTAGLIVVLFLFSIGRHDPPRTVIAMDFLLALVLDLRRPLRGALDVRAARPRRHARARGPRGADRRRRQRRPAGRLRAAPQPGPAQRAGRLRRRRPAQAGHARRRLQGARHDRRPAARARRRQARRGDHRDPLGAGHPAPARGHRLPRARHPRPDAADHLRAAVRRRDPDAPGARGPGGGRARPRARARGDRPRRRLPGRAGRARHRRRRLDRLRAVPPDRALRPQAAGAGRARREPPVRDPARARGGAPLRAHGLRARRLQGRHAHARGLRGARPVGGVPRRRLQARAADGGEPGRGRAQQRGRHAHRRRRRGRGRRGAVRAGVDRQGGQPRDGDGRLEGARGVGGRGGAEPLDRARATRRCASATCSARPARSCRSSAARSPRAAR